MREDIKRNEVRGVGKRFKKNKIKVEIVDYILNNSSDVFEPSIRAFLRDKYKLHDRTNISMHLDGLLEANCVEKIPGKRSLKNQWDIKTLKHLRNIKQYL